MLTDAVYSTANHVSQTIYACLLVLQWNIKNVSIRNV